MKRVLKKLTSLFLAVAVTATAQGVIFINYNEAAAEGETIVWKFEPEADIMFETNKTYYYTDTLSEVSTSAENELTIVTASNASSKDKLDATNKRVVITNAETSYIKYTPSEVGQLIANAKGMDIREVTDSGDVVISSNTSTDTPSDISAVCKENTTYKIITNATKYGGLYSLQFIPGEVVATPEPTAMPTAEPYQSPSTSWDFDTYTPALAETNNIPYMSGTAVYDVSGEVKMASDTKDAGYVTLKFDKPIENNVNISFDFTRHDNNLNGQHMLYKIVNSAGDEIVSLDSVLYNSTGAGLAICGETVASDAEFKTHIASTGTPTTIKTSVDYYAGTVTVTVGTQSFTGTIAGGTMEDIAYFEFSSTRSGTSSSRYLSFDDLSVEEFTSTATPAPESEYVKSFEEKTIENISGRVNAPTDSSEKSYPLVIFLHGENRVGDENENQLYDAEVLFEALKGNAILLAPQTADTWSKDALESYIETAKTEYNASQVVVAGYSMGAQMSWQLASLNSVSKIVPIAGAYSFTSDEIDEMKTNNVSAWAFSGYKDEEVSFANVRQTVSSLQKAGVNTQYTEFPMEGHSICKSAQKTDGLAEWILSTENVSKTVDLVLFAGQSNMAGRGDYDEATVCPPFQGYEFHSVTDSLTFDGTSPNVLSTVNEPFGKYENNSAINDDGSGGDRRNGDMVSSVMKAYYDSTGVPIVGVQASRGGQKTDYFMGASVMAEMQNRYNLAEEYLKAAGYTVRRKFMVWCQGCSDADSSRTAETYKTNLMSIFNSLKTETGINDMFIVRIGHYNPSSSAPAAGATPDPSSTKDAAYKVISDAQQELADETDNVYAVASFYSDHYFSLMRDHYHYYQAAYNEIGAEAGTAIAEVYGDVKPTPTVAPTAIPTVAPTATPTTTPTVEPTINPTMEPMATPTTVPTVAPTAIPDVDTTPHPIVVDSVKYVADSNFAEIVSIEERVGTVIFASFDENGKLVSISVKADHEIPFAVSTVAPDEKFVPTDDVRVYVWESLKTMKPLFKLE